VSAPGVRLPPLRREVLPNGLTLLVVERRGLPLVTLRLTLRAGGAQEPTTSPGLSTLTARMLRRGAGPLDAAAFAEELDFLGGLFGTGSGLDHVAVDAEFTSATLDRGLELLTAAIRSPRFDADELARERQRMVEEIRQARDDTDEMAEEAFLHYLHPDHPFGRCSVGSVRATSRLQRGDVARFHAERWSPSGGVLVCVGDVARDAFADRIREALGDWAEDVGEGPAPPEPEPLTGRPVVLVHSPGSRQVQVRIGNVGVPRRTPHWHALQVANTVFGGGFTSRLVDRIRVDEGLTYTIHSRFHPGRVAGPFVISTFTENAELGRLHELVTGLLSEFRRSGPTDAEVAAAQAYLAGMQPRRIETPAGLALSLSEAELNGLGLEAVTDYRRDVEAVGRAEAALAAARCLPDEHLLTTLVGDAEELAEQAAQLGQVRVVELDFAEAVAGPAPDGDRAS
jgi:zinc protease